MKNDQKYLELMALYKKVRGNPDKIKQADKVLDAALKLGKSGVSPDAKEAARYL
jgi:hypothetical protein